MSIIKRQNILKEDLKMKLKKYLDEIQTKIIAEGKLVEGYMYENGKKDDIEGLQTSGRCMAASLGFLLGENEGVVIDLPKQEDFPADPHGTYVVYRKEGKIIINPYKGSHTSGTLTFID